MISRRVLLGATILCLLVGGLGLALYTQQRIARCAYVPLLADELLPNADLAQPGDPLPQGWSAAAPGVQLGAFAIDGDGRSLQLIGVANYVQTPPITVAPGRDYCFAGRAITDSELGSPTRAQAEFVWQDATGAVVQQDTGLWQPVVLWQVDAPPAGWSDITAAFRAPPNAAKLLVRIHPASDDRVYLDAMHVREGGAALVDDTLAETGELPDSQALSLTVRPWPDNKRAAVAFTFDWETTMGGLIHSRSVGDPNFDDDPVQRGLRMREGITTTLALFRRYNVHATYYSTGYNFLLGNVERQEFMGNPTFPWANKTNGWTSDRWMTTPWFADDPYGTVANNPAWYFGDLVPLVQAAGHEIESHTFSHFYGGFVGAEAWQSDIAAWNHAAAERGVAPARSLAFPWSSSAGMSDADWDVLANNGITSVTRLSDRSQYDLFHKDAQGLVDEPRCRPWPGHEQILACPDFYLTTRTVDQAVAQIDRAVAAQGMIDIWAHTEEVTTPAQITTWERVVSYAAENRDIWVAPFGELADWQQALAQVRIEDASDAAQGAERTFVVTNDNNRALNGLTLQLPAGTQQVTLDGDSLSADSLANNTLIVDLPANQHVEIMVVTQTNAG